MDKGGKPKPLPCCLIVDKQIQFGYLTKFAVSEIENTFLININETNLKICLDCVLGLPAIIYDGLAKILGTDFKNDEFGSTLVSAPIRRFMKLTADFPGFGRKPASEFFRYLLKNQNIDQIPKRQVEVLCNANSVFKEKPFQKNIQTGTFRLWKEISLSNEQFYFPYLETKPSNKNSVPVFEGYPSLSWKLILNANKRQPAKLKTLMKSYCPDLIFTKKHQDQVDKDPNLADALVLALTVKSYEQHSNAPDGEGWILGAEKS